MDIHMLIEASHTLGKDRGFWEKEKDLREEILYILSNVGDIAKAVKKGRKANWTEYDAVIKSYSDIYDEYEMVEIKKQNFKKYIKDSFEDEIANVILRITDIMGGKKINITEVNPWIASCEHTELNYFFRNVKPTEEFTGNTPRFLNEAIHICMFHSNEDKDYGLSHILFYLGSIIEFYDIDIEKHLIKKIEYNRTRPTLYQG